MIPPQSTLVFTVIIAGVNHPPKLRTLTPAPKPEPVHPEPQPEPVHPEDHADAAVEKTSALDAAFNTQIDAMMDLSEEILGELRKTLEGSQEAREQLLSIVVQTLMSQSKDFGE